MGMETNKIFAAILVAGIIGMLAWFVSYSVYHPQKTVENGYPVEVAETSGSGAVSSAPAEAEPIDDLMAAADVAQGEKLSKVCMACHTFDKGGPNRVGPNLAGIVGAKHAHKSDFPYSDAMKAKSGEAWTVDALNKFLWNPKKAVPGTKMVFAGMKKPEDRAALIKWLQLQK
jgi:cytochrome c